LTRMTLRTLPFYPMMPDAGKSYVPIAAENEGSGHHRQTIVSFPKISPETKRIELIIKDVAESERENVCLETGVIAGSR
jgi:hypothetical protein